MKKYIVSIGFCFVVLTAMAQQNMTLYNMRSMYQRTYVNPGLLPDAKTYIGIPILGSQYINVSNSRLDIRGLNGVFDDQGNDSFFLNVGKLANLFEKRNYVNIEYNLDLVNFGFSLGKNRFGFNSTLKTMSKFSYPGDLLKILLEGNGGKNLNEDFDFGFGLDLQQYTEYGIWYGREHSDKLSFGGRLKYLSGISNVWLERSDISFRTNAEDFSLSMRSDIKLNAASMLFNPANLKADNLDSFLRNMKAFGGNKGMGIDLGAQYYVTKKIAVSASIIDLGFINWKSNVSNFESKFPNQYTTFNGVDFNDFFADSSDFRQNMETLADSLIDRFGLVESNNSYTRSLFTQFYLGGNYRLNKNHNAGVLFYGNFHNRRLYPGFTLSWNSKLTKLFSISGTYTMINNTFNNVGLGFSVNGGAYQFHFITDNILSSFIPEKSRMANIRFGMGFTLGRDKDEKK